MYKLIVTKHFYRSYKKLVNKNRKLETSVDKVMETLSKDPFSVNLRSHKVNSRYIGLAWSSRVTGDIRLIWDFRGKGLRILLLDIGKHDSVY